MTQQAKVPAYRRFARGLPLGQRYSASDALAVKLWARSIVKDEEE